ncbi:uncharacterized protein LOC117344854 [Pecten maximus]|uniref:uncharacterized protein LOC117344854 n=1 Tax=Pecten maximus TaxID=6579 RepID=UPI0014580DB7|nr:uncharacterized protein LOC117344854 [Pecten maximus]
MGCIESKGEGGHKRRLTLSSLLRRLQHNKVVPFIDNTAGGALNTGTPMLILTRKTERMVLQQLWAEGIIPKRRDGGVEFTIEIGDKKTQRNSHDLSLSILPGVPQRSTVERSRPVVLQETDSN